MLSISLGSLPFWLHILVELTPSLVFVTNPAVQLYLPTIYVNRLNPETIEHCRPVCSTLTKTAKPGAEAVIRQYGVLLFVSALIALIFALRKVDTTSRQVAAALTIYHLAPIVRAASRLWSGETGWTTNDLGGPWVHFAVHVACFVALGRLALAGFYADSGPRTERVVGKEE